ELWKQEHGGQVPDQFEGEQWQCQRGFEAGIAKAGSIEADKLRPALEGLTIDDIKGPGEMPKCGHQGGQPGLIFKGAPKEGVSFPVPEIIATLPAERTTPPCNKMTYDD